MSQVTIVSAPIAVPRFTPPPHAPGAGRQQDFSKKAGQAESSTPLAGQVQGMNASGRQTAPPRTQADFATFPRVLSLEASRYGSDPLCFAPRLRSSEQAGSEVFPHLATEFAAEASASLLLSSPAVAAA